MDAWTVGYLLGGVVVAAVVVLLLVLIAEVRRTAEKAEAIAEGLSLAQRRSAGLRGLDGIPMCTGRIREAAAGARAALTDRDPR